MLSGESRNENPGMFSHWASLTFDIGRLGHHFSISDLWNVDPFFVGSGSKAAP